MNKIVWSQEPTSRFWFGRTEDLPPYAWEIDAVVHEVATATHRKESPMKYHEQRPLSAESPEFYKGVEAVTSIRCRRHFTIPPLNDNESNFGECGACIASRALLRECAALLLGILLGGGAALLGLLP